MSLTGRHAVRVAVALLLIATTVAATALAAGCGDDGSENVSANEIDRAFAAEMIPHHEGAIEMAEVARERGAHREVKQLADDIIAAQSREIAQMRRWSARWYGSESGEGGHGEAGHME